MNSKILNPNLYQLSQLKKSITRWIYSASQSKLNDKKPSSPSSSPLNSQLLLNNNNNRFQLTQVRWTLRGGAGYTKFGHGKIKPKISKYGYFWYAILATGFLFVAFFDTESFMFRGREPSMRLEEMKQWYSTHSNSKAKEIDSSTKVVDEDLLIPEESQLNDDIVSELSDDDVVDNVKEKKEKITFRNRKIIQYENRIRQYSTPDKIFRYFATLSVWNEKLDDYEVYMTPEDFVRSITYGAKQPEGLGLDRYIRFDPQMQKLETNIDDDSIFRILNRQGIISFTDYIFLLTLLSTPTRHFEIAFYMFDEDGSGNIDLAEFEQLQAIIRSQTSSGQRHRDTRMTGSVIKDNHHLNEYFFGKELSELLTVDKFVSFQRRLQAEVIRMEFELCNLKTRESDGERVMSEMTFAEMILAYAGLGPSKTKKMLKKIASLYEGENSKQSKGITLRDYEDFFQILRSIHDIDTALKFYSIAGASIDKSILKHVSKTVANINLSDHVIDVIFNLFDENGDGKLTQKEFIKVMKKRWSRGLQQPKDTGFVKFIEALIMCSKEAVLSSPS